MYISVSLLCLSLSLTFSLSLAPLFLSPSVSPSLSLPLSLLSPSISFRNLMPLPFAPSLSLPLFLSPSLSPSLSHYLSLPLSLSSSVTLPLAFQCCRSAPSPPFSFSLSHFVSLILCSRFRDYLNSSSFLFLCHSSLSFSVYFSFSLPATHFVSMSLSHYPLSLVSPSRSRPFSVWCISLSLYTRLFLSLSLSLFLSLSPAPLS